jgi:hypothetical protein
VHWAAGRYVSNVKSRSMCVETSRIRPNLMEKWTNREGHMKKLRLVARQEFGIYTDCAVHLVRTDAVYATCREVSGADERLLERYLVRDCSPGAGPADSQRPRGRDGMHLSRGVV